MTSYDAEQTSILRINTLIVHVEPGKYFEIGLDGTQRPIISGRYVWLVLVIHVLRQAFFCEFSGVAT